MEKAAPSIADGNPFDFAISASGQITVEHRGQQLRWEFVVDLANGRRFLQPMKTRMNATDRRLTAGLRREAFAYAVAQARCRDVID